jgi:hypothetical protein
MTILHAGGTADTGDLLGGAVENTARAIAGISRGTIAVSGTQSYRITARDPATGEKTTFTAGWVHFVVAHVGNCFSGPPSQTFVNGAGIPILRNVALANGTASYDSRWQVWNGTAWVYITGTDITNVAGDTYTYDIFIDTATGRFLLHRAGVAIFDVTVPLLVGTNISTILFGAVSGPTFYYQQTLIATGEPTIGCTVRTRYATGAGEDTTWEGDYTAISEFPVNDDTTISAATAGDRESFAANALAPLNVGNEVKGVLVAARFRSNGSSPANLKPYLLIGGTRYLSATFPASSTGWLAGWGSYHVNPATGLAWGKDINTVNVQFGVEAAA